MKVLLLIVSMFCIVSCTDAGCGKLTSLGSSARVECFSGGKLIYSGESTGKVLSEKNSDGYYFKDKLDGKMKEVSGNCVIVYN